MLELLKDMIKYIIILFVVIIINIFIITLSIISGDSMNPKYKNNDLILVDKISMNFNKLDRFDIILLNTQKEARVVKRIIGLPKEMIAYKDNTLYINNEIVEQSFLDNTITEDFGPYVMGDDEYFVLGDNRTNSIDSRNYGFVNKKNIIGRSVIKLWPIMERK